MSHDVDQIAEATSRQPSGSNSSLDDSSRYDDLVIVDRPSLYSVRESAADYFHQPANDAREHSLTDPRTMIEKLKAEIAHLENWLSLQLESRPKSLSMANTIRNLIATRKSLLDNLLQKEKQRL